MTIKEDELVIPIPTVGPMGSVDNPAMIHGLWNEFVPDTGLPPSIEVRVLAGVLRAVHEGLLSDSMCTVCNKGTNNSENEDEDTE